jgi:hypothetical protein
MQGHRQKDSHIAELSLFNPRSLTKFLQLVTLHQDCVFVDYDMTIQTQLSHSAHQILYHLTGLQSRSRRHGLETYPTSRLISSRTSFPMFRSPGLTSQVSSRSWLLRSTRDLAVLVAAIANSNCNQTLSINLYQLYSPLINIHHVTRTPMATGSFSLLVFLSSHLLTQLFFMMVHAKDEGCNSSI